MVLTDAASRVLITGANGRLGQRLIRRLAERRTPVRAVVRSERAAETLRALPEPVRPELRVLDYADEEGLAKAADACDTAVHLVGIVVETSRSSYAVAHEDTSRALSRAAERAGLRRLVYLSILGADPDSPNACLASKGRAERILIEAAMPAVILRVPMVLGPGDPASRMLRAQARARWVPLLRGGACREQPIDADDVVAAVVAASEHAGLDDVVIDLAGPESLSRRALLERCAALYGRRPRVIPVPLAAQLAVAFLIEQTLADPPLSRAMVGVLDHDDDVDADASARRLGISLTPLDETLRRCVGPEAGA